MEKPTGVTRPAFSVVIVPAMLNLKKPYFNAYSVLLLVCFLILCQGFVSEILSSNDFVDGVLSFPYVNALSTLILLLLIRNTSSHRYKKTFHIPLRITSTIHCVIVCIMFLAGVWVLLNDNKYHSKRYYTFNQTEWEAIWGWLNIFCFFLLPVLIFGGDRILKEKNAQ